MADLFGIDIAGILHNATEQAGGALPLTLTRYTPGTRNPAAPLDGTNPTTAVHAGKGFRNDPNVKAGGHGNVAGDNVETEMTEIWIYRASLPAGVKPEPRDTIALTEPNGLATTWVVVKVMTDPAAAMYGCTCRARA